jgi:hypothetical protein
MSFRITIKYVCQLEERGYLKWLMPVWPFAGLRANLTCNACVPEHSPVPGLKDVHNRAHCGWDVLIAVSCTYPGQTAALRQWLCWGEQCSVGRTGQSNSQYNTSSCWGFSLSLIWIKFHLLIIHKEMIIPCSYLSRVRTKLFCCMVVCLSVYTFLGTSVCFRVPCVWFYCGWNVHVCNTNTFTWVECWQRKR